MPAAPLPADEALRLAALRRYGALDSPPDDDFDDLVRLASQICGAPIALITLVDEHRQWFMAKVGLDIAETPRSVAFCAHALNEPDLLTVTDAAEDARFADNPLVTGEPHIRFYAGAPLVTSEGQALGTLCVIDRQPRRLAPEQEQALRMLSRQAMALLERRRMAHELAALGGGPPAILPERANGSARWIPVVFWAALLVLLLITLHTGRGMLDAQALATQRLQVRQLLLESKNLVTALQSAEIGQRGYLLVADPASLRSYDAAVAEVGQRLAAIETLTRNPGLPPFDLQALRSISARQLAELDAALETYRRDGPAAALQLVRRGHDSQLSDAARAIVGAQTSSIERALDDRVRRGNEHIDSALQWLAIGTLASTIALLGGFSWLRREMRQREHAVAALARSHLSVERQVADRTAALLAANSALRASEAFLRSIGDHLPGGVVYQLLMEPGSKPRFLHVSAGIERINGVTAQAVLDDSDTFFDQIVEEDRPAWLAARAEADRSVRAFSVDARIRRPDGELRWCHYTASPRRLADDRVLWDGIALDITERKRIEADREQLLERLSDAFFTLDAGWRFSYANIRAAEIVDRPRAALIGKNIWAEFPPFVETPFYAACQRALAEQRFELSLDYNPAIDRWFESRIYPSRDGVSVFTSDVTESKRAERALRESEARVRLALEASNIGLWEWRAGSNEVYYSPLLKRQMGYEDHEIANRAETWQQHMHSDDLAAARAKLAASTRPPWPRYEYEYRLRHKDGSYRWIRATAAMLLDDDGKPLRLLGTQQDITERKRADAALRTTEAQLHELLAQLQRAQEAERIRISRQIHDELGQLLTGVKMDLRWLERKLGEPGVPRGFNALLDRTVAASELNDQTIATVQRIAAELRPTALDQLGLAAALTQAARRFQARSGVACTVEAEQVEAVLPAAVANDLFYICQEALTNVARHAQATAVEIELHAGEGEACLEVRDNGVGIDPALIEGRHSLGLLGMRERALHCHGALQVQRLEPRGTRVSVRVPLAVATESASA